MLFVVFLAMFVCTIVAQKTITRAGGTVCVCMCMCVRVSMCMLKKNTSEWSNFRKKPGRWSDHSGYTTKLAEKSNHRWKFLPNKYAKHVPSRIFVSSNFFLFFLLSPKQIFWYAFIRSKSIILLLLFAEINYKKYP